MYQSVSTGIHPFQTAPGLVRLSLTRMKRVSLQWVSLYALQKFVFERSRLLPPQRGRLIHNSPLARRVLRPLEVRGFGVLDYSAALE